MNPDLQQPQISVADLIQAVDWSKTPVGPVEAWPRSLKATIKTVLGSRYPMILLWGKSLIQIYNDAYTGLIGAKHPHALGRSIKETQAESWETIGPMIHQVMTTGIPNWVPAQLLAVNRSGFNEETYFSLSYSAVENDQDEITGMLCVCSEVTQQVLGERRLRLQRDLASKAGETRSTDKVCRDIINAIGEYASDVPFAALYIRDPGGSLTLSGTVGVSDNAFCPETFDPKIAETDPWCLRQALAGEMALNNNVSEVFTTNGGIFNEPVQGAFSLPIASSIPNEPLGILIAGISPNCVLDDGYKSFFELLAGQVSVSLRNAQAYEEERKRAEALARIDKAKTDFFSNVSHEFRTPLTLLLGPLKDVLTGADHQLDKQSRQQLGTVYQNALRLLKLVNSLLDFSRIEANRAQATFAPVDLSSLTIELASSFESAIKKASLDYIIDCAPLPEPVYVDYQMWEKIVFNLLSNALKFTFSGKIEISLRETQSNIILSVADTGIGIPSHEISNVFTRFHRIQNAMSRSHEGTGIGLALVKELVALHGGTIDVSSEENKGTTFTVRIPKGSAHLDPNAIQVAGPDTISDILKESFLSEAIIWSGDEESQAPLSTPGELAEQNYAHKDAVVLIVDDNIHMLRYLQRILKVRWNVVTARNGREAMEQMRSIHPDLILSDVMMPEVDGFQLLAEVRQHAEWNNIPFILLSARAGQEATVDGLQKGANDYLVKPFYAQELVARVATHLEIKRTRLDNLILHESERKFRTVAESIPEKVWTCNPLGAVTFCNQKMSTFSGLSGKEAAFWSELIHPADLANVVAIWQNILPVSTECRLRRHDGEYIWHVISAVPEKNEQGTITSWIGSCVDIHNQKQFTTELEKKVQERTVELDLINKELEQFAYAASHDLQEPLRKIITFTELVDHKLPDKKDDIAQYLRKIITSSERMKALIADLLNFSRLTHIDQQFRRTDLNTVIEELKEDFELTILQKNASFECDTLPVLEAIPLQMNQLWSNLIGNALKFTRDGRQPQICIRCRELEKQTLQQFPELDQARKYFRIDFSDNGIGFEEQYAEQIFALFKKLNTNDAYSGTGVGLALCKRIVQNHKGKIFATAKKDEGATFTVLLPETHGT